MRPRLSVQGKLMAGFAVVILLACLLGWLGLRAAARANGAARHLGVNGVVELSLLGDASADALAVRERVLEHTIARTPEAKARLEREIQHLDREVTSMIAALQQSMDGPGEARALADAEAAWQEYRRLRDELTLRLSDAGDAAAARAAATGPVGERFARVEQALATARALSKSEATALVEGARTDLRGAERLTLGLLLGGTLLALGLAVAVSRRVAGGVARVAHAAEALSAGHLAARVPVRGDDELGLLARSFNTMAGEIEALERRREALAGFSACALTETDVDLLFLTATVALVDGLGTDRRTALKLLPPLRDWDGEVPAEAPQLPERPFDEEEQQFVLAVWETLSAAVRRTRAETALAASEARFRSLIQNSSDLTLLVDRQGKIQFASPSAARVAGCRPEELVGRSGLAFVHWEDRYRVATALAEVADAPGFSASGEFRVRSAVGDGWVELDGVARNLTGDPAIGAIVFNGRDVSERRRAEEERRALEEQLRHSQKMEAIGNLAGGIAHDFNNLLTAILGYCQLSLDQAGADGDPLLRAYLEEIAKAGERAAALTNQLLAYSRKQMLRPRVFDVGSVVADLEPMLRRVLGELVDLRTELVAGLAPVRADPHQLEQVVVNLAVNARDAMPEGGVLTIETANVELDDAYARFHAEVVPGRYVRLAVSDTGVGMDEATRARAFEPFFTTKGPGKGTGLGLAMVHGIVRQSGGHVTVYSEPGRGTTFKIYLPAVDEPPHEKRDAVAVPSAEGTETILLVEDEDAVRSLAARGLAALGYTVLEARDGSEVLALAEGHPGPIALVLTDVVLPSVTGRQVYEAIAGLRSEARVLYMSGYAEGAIVNGGEVDDDAPFISKPFALDALARRVREILDA